MRAQIWLILSVAILFSFGLVMVFNTTSAEMLDRALDASYHTPLLKQLMYGIVGMGLGFAIYSIGYDTLVRGAPLIFGFVCLLLILCFVPKIGQMINGSRRWLHVLGFSYQPSELMKIAMPLMYIHWFLKRNDPVSLQSFLKVLALLTVPIVLIVLEPDHGTTAILLSLLVILFFLTRIRLIYWAMPLIFMLAIGVWGGSQIPYVKNRIQVYLHPEKDLLGKGHQPHQAKIAAGSGQLLGRGLGESLQKLNYLPEARSDYIAAIFAEEMGFVGVLGLIMLYLTFTFSGIGIAMRATDASGYYLATTLTFLVAIQAFLNLGIVSGLLPSKGTTLPFFSQGGSSLVVNLIVFFLLLSISRKSEKSWVKKKS
jgi:cell division protein FtsW